MSVDTKVHEAVEELTAVVDRTEKNKENADQLRRLAGRLARVTDNAEDYTEAVRVVLGADRVGTYREMLAKAGELTDAIDAITSPAVEEVGTLAETLRGLVTWLDGQVAADAERVLERWDRLSLKKKGATSKPDLGFTVRVKCEACRETVASTQKVNVNSLRDQVRQHHGKVHGVKFGQGDAIFSGLTEAIKAVMFNGSNQAQGGGYAVLK